MEHEIDSAISKTACYLLAYLANNPDAKDTLEGIVEWWMLQPRIRSEIAKVERALVTELVATGLVLSVNGPDSKVYYKLNQERYNDIQKILERMCK